MSDQKNSWNFWGIILIYFEGVRREEKRREEKRREEKRREEEDHTYNISWQDVVNLAYLDMRL